MLTTILDLLGLGMLIAFAYFVWPPLMLLVAAVGLLLMSRQLVRSRVPVAVTDDFE